jgi:ribonuclease HII
MGHMIVGIDEVGRGAWAGPLVVGAVGLGGVTIDGLTDSKLLSKKKRQQFSRLIKQQAPLIGIGWVSAKDIDTIGLSAALHLAARRAFDQIDTGSVDQIIIDGTIKLIDDPRVTLMKKADLLIPSVSAAAIIAKVARDDYMGLCDRVFDGYGFAGHVGYGAASHSRAIDTRGVLPIHRASFAPIAKALGNNTHLHIKKDVASTPATNITSGSRAEDEAARFLEQRGFRILDRNWKTKWCEIDIVASKDDVISFVEVKYRKSLLQGGGVAAVDNKKQKQMRFAAELWLHSHKQQDAKLSVIELTGDSFDVSNWVEQV